MSAEDGFSAAANAIFDGDEVASVLSGEFFSEPPPERLRAKPVAKPSKKPTHYKVICISMYTDDLERLDEMVGELKKRGLTKANRSALIRHALDLVDLDKVPRGL